MSDQVIQVFTSTSTLYIRSTTDWLISHISICVASYVSAILSQSHKNFKKIKLMIIWFVVPSLSGGLGQSVPEAGDQHDFCIRESPDHSRREKIWLQGTNITVE